MILWQILPLSLLLLCSFMTVNMVSGVNSGMVLSEYLLLDSFGVCLSMMPLFSMLSLMVVMVKDLKAIKVCLILLSMLFSMMCFKCNKFMLFFMCYEMSMMLLLFSLFTGSPYSERSLAGWYFLGYLVVGGVPLLLICMYKSLKKGAMSSHDYGCTINYLLFFLFITKVPLFPFHGWLPMVHAEANSYSSMMLSGYMMKLGILGMVRMFSTSGELLKLYVVLFFMASCFFLMSSLVELDKKRWLAFLSLGHMSMGILGVLMMPTSMDYLVSSFSLGHGLSVMFLFHYFNMKSSSMGSRNWVVMMNNKNSGMAFMIMPGLLSLMAFPPSMLFFKEVFMFMTSLGTQSITHVFYLYILLGVMAPICMLSVMSSRLSNSTDLVTPNMNYLVSMCSMVMFYLYFLMM